MYSRIVIYFLYKQPDRQIIRCPNPRSSRLSTLVSVLKGKLHKHSSFIRQTPPCFQLENPQRNLVLIQCTLLPWTRCPQVPRISLFSHQEEGTEQPALRPRVSSATSAPEPSEVSVTSLERFNIQNKSVCCWCTALLNTNAVHMWFEPPPHATMDSLCLWRNGTRSLGLQILEHRSIWFYRIIKVSIRFWSVFKLTSSDPSRKFDHVKFNSWLSWKLWFWNWGQESEAWSTAVSPKTCSVPTWTCLCFLHTHKV